jgi:hypothetical protein
MRWMNASILSLSEEELWLVHDHMAYLFEVDGEPVGKSLLPKVEDAILLCTGGEEEAALNLTENELWSIASTISSKGDKLARKLLLKVMHSLWEIRYGLSVKEEPKKPTSEIKTVEKKTRKDSSIERKKREGVENSSK